MIEKWKKALSTFLEKYEDNEDVIGALLTGSYASGNQNKNSDIDVCIILKDSVDFQERGDKLVNGYLIEYFMNPSWKIKEYFDKNYDNGMCTMANMFCYGKVIFDTEGKVKELQDLATKYIDKELKPLKEQELLNNNYHIWDYYNELKTMLEEDSKYFYSVYYNLINKVLQSYYKYLQIPLLPEEKAYKILTNNSFREKYHIFKLPDEKFIDLYVNCYTGKDKQFMYDNITKLITYYYDKTGGFDINNFIIRKDLY